MKIKSIYRPGIAVIFVALLAACSSSDDGTTTDGDNLGESGVLPVILDRMGRPGVTTALIASAEDKDAYNLEGDPAAWATLFSAAIEARATAIDSLDAIEGNALDSPDAIAGLLVDDRLRIDTSIPECDVYLALEAGVGGCGGRTLERDVINDTLQHLVSEGNPVDDLADNDSNFQSVWPFIGVAN